MSSWQEWINDPRILKILKENEAADVSALALQWSGKSDLPVSWMLQQISCRQIAKRKLPEWYALEKIVYPDRTALEQCSSTTTALYKQRFAKEKKVADITGGLGVDTWALSLVAASALYCEPDPLRFEIARHNFIVLGLTNVECINTTAENALGEIRNFNPDLIYADPSRRDSGKRFFKLEDLQPDIMGLFPQLLEISNYILIKAAPMLDLKLGIRQLERAMEVHVISMKNECRELLFLIDGQLNADPQIHCVEFNSDRHWKYDFRYSEEEISEMITGPAGNFILDPFACITKAGCFRKLTSDFEVRLLHANTHVYTSASKPKGFPGRSFKVMEIYPYDIGLIRESIPDKKAHLLFRNFPVKPEEVEKKLKFTSGGNTYLFFVTDHSGKLRVINCEQL